MLNAPILAYCWSSMCQFWLIVGLLRHMLVVPLLVDKSVCHFGLIVGCTIFGRYKCVPFLVEADHPPFSHFV